MTEENNKEVRFDIWCKKCKYEKVPEDQDPCWDCLLESVRQSSMKPALWEEK